MKHISIINNKLLKEHEQIIPGHLDELYQKIKNDGYISAPLIVDKNTLIILDGHHRFNVLKLLGMSSSPVYLC
ncbi:hypothetical protein COY90_02555 [Candidatus Roizmanbacteria bacterium CG_4_10_14_0_8_um_filter_39_9]|uniref:ParB-like N-terminal domain-containing protein n=1 Tax=Candidatus Roizmanbacteria bacterium CG_4_10_14_0_8_um_filter_39_9 TaxID=1974829 RepID=A0A2M7QDS1_9BACT|nr:MAG: hypothetical protein COY90_02555 [Candidatus Roizmanbacteria bacterium CG_4_10_14_0_8_um_filter_39_9]